MFSCKAACSATAGLQAAAPDPGHAVLPPTQCIKLGDLGVAKHFEGTLELAITCLGTPYYMCAQRALAACGLLLPALPAGLPRPPQQRA